MRPLPPALRRRLESGVTYFCHGWLIERRDGVRLGLSDHDADLTLDGVVYHAGSGMTLSALDIGVAPERAHPQAEGVLGSPHLHEADLRRGLYDEARFSLFLIDWRHPQNRLLLVSGRFGPVQMVGPQFRVALRLQGDELSQTAGRLYQRDCDAVLGDARCGFALTASPFIWQTHILSHDRQSVTLPPHDSAAGWFRYGEAQIGDLPSLSIRDDHLLEGGRHIRFWQEISPKLAANEPIRLRAGCDKSFATCRSKFSNQLNFQGFPDLSDDRVLVNVGPQKHG